MAIDIRIDGNPQEMRAAGTWLRNQLAVGVHDCNSGNHQARSRSEPDWVGTAGDSFRGMLTQVAPKVEDLVADIDGVGKSFESCADSLHTAQEGMRRARDIALAGGLQVAGTIILDPGPAPRAPQPPPANASPQTVRAHEQAAQAHQAHAVKVKAYADAKQEADLARSTWRWARDTARAYWENVWAKRYLHVSNFANGVAGNLIGQYESSLTKSVAKFDEEIDVLRQARAGKKEVGSGMWRYFDDKIDDVLAKQASVISEASTVAKYSSRAVPIAGLVLTGIGIGMDIRSGKPPGRVIFSAAVGTVASALVAGALLASAPVSVTVLAAIGVGIGASMFAKWAYDEFMPEDWQKSINEGFYDACDAVAQGTDDVVDSITGTVKSIF